ncbi:testis-expressed protein 45 [Echinops telfairi]|uniref:Testis-expressed protein 45 n=1 Tax=Echinops telfairi TaxID=9371 RepID=A0AC55D3D3_ECHTE|nr:testis-expressed protein 45 [Echinops telfairi]
MASTAPAPYCMPLQDFLRASHFALGPDLRLQLGAMYSTSRRDFQGHPEASSTRPSPQPPRAPLFPSYPRWALGEPVSESHRMFFPLQPGFPPLGEVVRERKLAMQVSNLRMHADARARVGVSNVRASFGWPELPARVSEQIRQARLIFAGDSVPPGDRAKLGIPLTTHQEFFRPPAASAQPSAPCCHLGERTSVPQQRGTKFGLPGVFDCVPHCDRTPQSHILEGNQRPGPGSLTTTTQFFMGQPPPLGRPAHRHLDHEKLQDHVTLREKSLLGHFFQTSMSTDYPAVEVQRPVKTVNLHLLPSALFKDRVEPNFATTNRRMLVPHRADQVHATEEQLQQCKDSHIEPPLGGQRCFSTSYKEQFPSKYQGPVTLTRGSSQESHVFLSMPLQSGCQARKDPRAPQMPIYPCPSQQ